MFARLSLLLALVCFTGCDAESAQEAALRAAARSDVLHYRVDFDQARKVAWANSCWPAPLDQLAENLETKVDDRLQVEVSITPQSDGTIAVRFDEALAAESRMEVVRFLDLAGVSEFRIVAAGQELRSEEEALNAWRKDNPDAPLRDFNDLPADEGGSPGGLTWMVQRAEEGLERPPLALLPRPSFPDTFEAFDLDELYASVDRMGYPAIGFSFAEDRLDDFYAYTGRMTNRPLAIVLGGVIVSAPTIDEALPGGGIIRGRFTDEYVKAQIKALRTGGSHAFLRRVH